jgi:sortase (surface protein transpeptidase)
VLVAVVAAALVAVVAVVAGSDAGRASGRSAARSMAWSTVPAAAGSDPVPGAAAPVAAPAPAPTRVRIPAIGVDSPLVELGMDGGGVLVPPATADVAGWFAAGPAPGAAGPALLAGHVDSQSGPGVFFRLRDVAPGDRIEIDRSDGSVAAFVVSARTQTSKSAFPTDLVYAPTPGPELRLVTCGGGFDRSARSYQDNIVVQAVAADGTPWTIPR